MRLRDADSLLSWFYGGLMTSYCLGNVWMPALAFYSLWYLNWLRSFWAPREYERTSTTILELAVLFPLNPSTEIAIRRSVTQSRQAPLALSSPLLSGWSFKIHVVDRHGLPLRCWIRGQTLAMLLAASCSPAAGSPSELIWIALCPNLCKKQRAVKEPAMFTVYGSPSDFSILLYRQLF